MKNTEREDLAAWREDARRAAIKRQHDAPSGAYAGIQQHLSAYVKGTATREVAVANRVKREPTA